MLIGTIGRTAGASWEVEVDLSRELHWCRSGRSCPVLSYRDAHKTVGVSHTGMAAAYQVPRGAHKIDGFEVPKRLDTGPHPSASQTRLLLRV